LMMLIVLILTF